MNNSQFLQTYLDLQCGIAFDQIIDLKFAKVCYGQIDDSPFWNNALVCEPLSDKQISQIVGTFNKLNRKPAFYFEDTSIFKSFSDNLLKLGYKFTNEDSFMFHSGKNIDEKNFGNIQKVETLSELKIYLQTLDACYQKDDPKNPYGELGDYLLSAEKAWKNHHSSGRLEYFLAYKNGNPVAVATLNNFENLGYISNVGSLLSVRGQGFGKSITLSCVAKSKANGNLSHFLATEEGTNPNEFYTSLGFETQLKVKLMVEG